MKNMIVKRVRAGLYDVTTPSHYFRIEHKQSPADWGSEWLWYITDMEGQLQFDPVYTKRDALQDISDFYTH
ncbi:hypothetical protein Wildcat_170 [Mycobacterium phage Wildcat]|uniref:Uncharacterized protein n=3 Tax=Mycobacterium virus Wildcat TaxID=1993859 RepID=Q19XR4_9CAUD|nr:hypothetical protein Wildcat_170 [Mycobacterium phage Wildcat]ABE67750.1 hypothetical protein Wildcat_170 [Mycobacterium phage Wildcat]AQT25812.1 hypothetical protein EniyanLRS_163 [Mycobacterium phage EniyanLRS]QGJ90027.1 hypothetical protein PBI_MARYV_156 [Mycobacterium phage MaryV]